MINTKSINTIVGFILISILIFGAFYCISDIQNLTSIVPPPDPPSFLDI